MAETLLIPVSQTVWTDVSRTSLTGTFTNNSEHTIRYRISIAQPSDSDDFGHVLHPQVERTYQLEVGERIWALGFYDDAKVALTEDFTGAALVNAVVEFKDTGIIDAFGRLRSSEPFGVFDNKNVSIRNRNQWEEDITGAIITYNTLVGVFQAAEEIRGTLPADIFPIGTVVTDNGVDAMVIDIDHNDFQVGDTVTGQTSGATATIVSTDTGSDIQLDYDTASVLITTGVGATDSAVRQSHRYNAYVPGKSQFILMTFVMGAAKTNVVRRIGYFDPNDGLFLEQNGTVDVALVRRTSTSGIPVDNRIPQADWNLDQLDGTGPSKIILDLSKTQIFTTDFQWLGVGRIRYGFDIAGVRVYVHEILNANALDVVFMRTPTLPVRYEQANSGVPASPSSMHEICCSVVSEGGYSLPGYEFSQSRGVVNRSITTLEPIFAIRLKNEFPAGRQNRRTVKFINSGVLTETNDAHFYIKHIHEAVDLVHAGPEGGADWIEVGGGSAVEYSINITALTGRPAHTIENIDAPTGQANKAQAETVSGEFINFHGFISQNIDSTNSQMFVIFAEPVSGTANVRGHISWIEFD